jgi:hypothetical protein
MMRVLMLFLLAAAGAAPGQSAEGTTVAQLVSAIRARAKASEGSAGTRLGFRAFTASQGLQPGSVSYSDYAVVRLLFEATRDAGFWNLHWVITNREPNSDNIWRQWKTVKAPSPVAPTASAECDELSALFAFLAAHAGMRGVGLFWPASNHTVAVWELHPPLAPVVRVVVPTTQIFLAESDMFGTRRFDPWRQKAIHEYTRRDVPDTFELPRPLFDFMLQQADKYAGATDTTLQRLRYLREGVFLGAWKPEAAAREALKARSLLGSGPREDLAAWENFVRDMRVQNRGPGR